MSLAEKYHQAIAEELEAAMQLATTEGAKAAVARIIEGLAVRFGRLNPAFNRWDFLKRAGFVSDYTQ